MRRSPSLRSHRECTVQDWLTHLLGGEAARIAGLSELLDAIDLKDDAPTVREALAF